MNFFFYNTSCNDFEKQQATNHPAAKESIKNYVRFQPCGLEKPITCLCWNLGAIGYTIKLSPLYINLL